MKYLISNLKSNKTLEEIICFENKIKKIKTNLNLIICPSHPYYLSFTSDNYILGAQDISRKKGGAYTGEVNGIQLANLNVKYVLVGHSERRECFKETEKTFKKKIKHALENNIKVIYCIGETKEENLRQKTYVVLEKQLATVLNEFTKDELKDIIIAYEPIWAINSDDIPNTNELTEIFTFIKKLVKQYYEVDIEVVYGGSCNEKTIEELVKIENIDGILVGNASLEADNLIKIIKKLQK